MYVLSQRHPVWVTENHVNPCNSVEGISILLKLITRVIFSGAIFYPYPETKFEAGRRGSILLKSRTRDSFRGAIFYPYPETKFEAGQRGSILLKSITRVSFNGAIFYPYLETKF
jgi:hypothetical protein